MLVNMVASVDGATAVTGRAGPLASPADTYVFHLLRSLADVILVGAETVRAEGYGPARVAEEHAPRRAAAGQAPEPTIAIVTASLDLDWSSRLFTEAKARPIVIAPVDSAPDRLERAATVADLLLAGEGRVDLAEAVRQLGARGATTVLCEGGPKLNGQLADLDLVDELCVTVSPALVGATSAPLLGMAPLAHLRALDLVAVLEEEGFLFLRYRVHPGPGPGEESDAAGAEAIQPVEQGAESAATAEDDDERRVAEVEPAVEAALDSFVDELDYPMFIVTAAAAGRRGGCLIGFAAQCSIDPPRFMVWLSKKNATFRLAQQTDVLAVHALSADDRALAELFGSHSTDDVDKLAQCAWTEGPGGVPVLTDVRRRFVGRIIDRPDGGDHVGFLLDPIAAESSEWSGQLGFQSVRDIPAGHDP